MYYSMQLVKLAAHIPSDVPSNFRCSKLLTNLSQNPWLDPNLPATYCWYKSWWNSSASWRIFFQVLLKIFSIKRLLLKMLQALCVSSLPPSLSPQTKMVGRGWCYVEKMVISFTSLRLHKAPKHRETLLSNFKHQPWFFSWNRLQKHQPSAITWLRQSSALHSQRQQTLWLQLVGAKPFYRTKNIDFTVCAKRRRSSHFLNCACVPIRTGLWWLANCIDPLIQLSPSKPIKIWRNFRANSR